MTERERSRRHPRFTVEDLGGHLVFASEVEVLNLSLGGVAIRADRRLDIGAEYTLKLDMGDRFIAMPGVVVWSVLSGIGKAKGGDAPQYSAGLRFTGVMDEKAQGLIEFIGDNRIVEEYRLAGLRLEVEAAGKAVLDGLESYRVRLISLSGMLIEADRGLERERVYDMYFQPPGGGRVAFAGRVASCLEEGGGPRRYRIGVEFVELADADRQRLERFLSTLTGSPAP
ncbi:MAG TPA: PilZ domain-containing protein [Vicinamibacteria bacterium]|nr:PilZ domain-containing protein [Vicinamibacteria bacterium]